MALSKSITSPSGIAAVYWVAEDWRADPKSGTIGFYMRGYASQALHASGVQPLDERRYNLALDPNATLPVPNGTLLQNVHAFLDNLALAQLDFTGASVVA